MMISNIKYVQDKDNNQRKLIKELIQEQVKKFEKEMDMRIVYRSYLYELVLYAKYLIEKNNLDIRKIVEGNYENLELLLEDRFKVFNNPQLKYAFSDYELNVVLKKIIFDDYEISTYMDRVLDNYIVADKKYLLISTHDIDYIKYSNVDIYLDIHPTKIERKKVIDEILGNNRIYYNSLAEVNFKDYDEIIYINDGREYKHILDTLPNKLNGLTNIFMICKYADISRYDDLICIESIMLDKDKTYIKYRVGNCKINEIIIKELSKIDDSELKDTMNSNKKKKDVCIHVTREDFRKHNYRVGINTYKNDINNDKTKIIKLIDYNKSITNRLRELDEEISKQIDEMIVR